MFTAGVAELSIMQVWQNNQEIKNGRFRIQKVLGAGGFGVTYLASNKTVPTLRNGKNAS
jgi:hypothetical protein